MKSLGKGGPITSYKRVCQGNKGRIYFTKQLTLLSNSHSIQYTDTWAAHTCAAVQVCSLPSGTMAVSCMQSRRQIFSLVKIQTVRGCEISTTLQSSTTYLEANLNLGWIFFFL